MERIRTRVRPKRMKKQSDNKMEESFLEQIENLQDKIDSSDPVEVSAKFKALDGKRVTISDVLKLFS